MERHTSLSNGSRVKDKKRGQTQCPRRPATAPTSLSPLSSGQTPCVGTLLPRGQCGEEWPCDQVLAKERSNTLLKRLSRRRGKKKKGGGGEWSSHSLGQPALQSVGRTSPRPVWPPSWGPCPIPTRSPRHAGASGLIAHTQGLQGPDTS